MASTPGTGYNPYNPPENIFRNNDAEVLKWCTTGVERGKNILRLQAAWDVAEVCMRILLGRDRIRRLNGMSTLTIKKLRRMLREQIAVQTNIRPRWGYKSPSEDEKKKSIATAFTKLLDFWWLMGFTDRRFRECGQFAGGGGTGYLMLEIDNNFDGIAGNVQISAVPLDYRQFIPFHRQQNWNIQKLSSAAIWFEMDLAEAREKYPWAKDIIEADRNIPSSMAKSRQSDTGFWRGVVDRFRRRRGRIIEGESPCVDILHVYVRDKKINTKGQTVFMPGMPGISEEYEVLSYYVDEPVTKQNGEIWNRQAPNGRYINVVETGEFDSLTKEPKYRSVTMEECMYYPNRRLIVYCSQGIIFDSGAPNLHGRIPLSQFRLDDVVGELLGFPVMMDSKSAVDAGNNVLRTIEDSIHSKYNIDIGVDKSVPKDVVEALRRPKTWRRQVFQYPISTLAKAIVAIMPPDIYNVDKDAYGFVDKLFEWADYLSGTKDVNNFAKLRQLPAGDTVQNILQAMGDLPVDQSRNFEAGLLGLGPVFMGLALQIYTTERLMQIVGPEAVKDFIDFNPIDLVPLESKVDRRPRWLRARDFMRQFPFYASPNSLNERQSMTQQLKKLQARNAQVPIANKLIFESMFPEEDWGENYRQWKAEQLEQLKLMADLEVYKQELAKRIQAESMLMGMLNQIIPTPENGDKEGRPPTNKAAAESQVKTDDNGVPRTTLATSGEG